MDRKVGGGGGGGRGICAVRFGVRDDGAAGGGSRIVEGGVECTEC